MAVQMTDRETRQLGLFDREKPSVALTPPHEMRLAMLVEALLLEIAAALALEGAGDDQDHA
jgi:hypothetical protein